MARFRAIFESRGFTRVLQLIFGLATMIVVFSFDQTISVNLNCKPTSGDSNDAQDKEISVTKSDKKMINLLVSMSIIHIIEIKFQTDQ